MLILIIIVLLAYIFTLKIILEKNKKNDIYYREIPTKDSPAYVGKVIKGHTDGNDIVSTILDLNMRGFIDISEKNINGKLIRELLYTGKNKNTELEEHEIFLIDQLFKDSDKIILEDYISSDKFKNDFNAFDKMLDRKVQRKIVKKDSIMKNITKLIFLTTFSILGITIFYAIFQPIMLLVVKDDYESIVFTLIISTFTCILITYLYISYINRKQLIKNILTIKIAYIFCFMIILLLVTTLKYENMVEILQNEIEWYKIILNFIIAIVTLLYMFNIISCKDEKNYLILFSVAIIFFAIILNCKLAMCISIVLLSIYSFMITPRYVNFKDEDYIDKWQSFKSFLEDYSLLKEKEEKDILIWNKYLIYAISLGVNKKIVKEYAKLAHINLLDKDYYKKFYIEYID